MVQEINLSLSTLPPFTEGPRPRRQRLEEARRVAGATQDGRAAWDLLARAGVLPRTFASSTARVFRLVTMTPVDAASRRAGHLLENMDGGPPGRQSYFITDQPHPFTAADAIAIASDIPAVEAVEAAAFELCRRLSLWFCPLPKRVAWRFRSATERMFCSPSSTSAFSDIRAVLEEAFEDAGLPFAPATTPAAASFRLACEKGLTVPSSISDPYFVYGASGPPLVPAGLVGRRFRDLPDPFEVARVIEGLGYQLDAITEDHVVLFAPPL